MIELRRILILQGMGIRILLILAFAGVAPAQQPDPLAKAVALQGEGRFADSIAPLQELLGQRPGHAEANLRLGRALLSTGEPNRAVWPLARAAEDESTAVEAGSALVGLFAMTRNYDAAIAAASRLLEIDPSRVDIRLARAAASLDAADPGEAVADAEGILATQPDNAQAQLLLAKGLAALGRLEEAEAAFDKLVLMAEKTANSVLSAAACQSRAAFYAEAREDAERAGDLFADCCARFPTYLPLLQAATAFHEGRDEPREATDLWRRAHAESPDEPAVRFELARRLEEAGDYDEAEALLAQYAQARGTADAWSVLASFHHRRGDPAAERAALDRAVAAAAEPSELLEFMRADSLIADDAIEEAEELLSQLETEYLRDLMQARILAARGDHAGAMEALDRGLPHWPNNAGARLLAGRVAEVLGDFDRALEEYRAAVRADRDGTDAALYAAQLYLALGQYRYAAEFAQLHATSHPESVAAAYAVAARALTAAGLFRRARAVVEQIRRDGDEVTATIEGAAVERAAAGPAAAADAVLGGSLDLADPDNEGVLRVVADDLLAADRQDEALRLAVAASERNPQSAGFHDVRGRVLYHGGRRAEARDAFQRALAVDSTCASALAGLATLSAAAGDTEEAVVLFDRAARYDPDNHEHAYRAAQLRLAAKQIDEAERRLREIVRAMPTHAEACNDLAWILAEKGEDLDFAEQLARRAVRLRESAETTDTLAFVERRRAESATDLEGGGS